MIPQTVNEIINYKDARLLLTRFQKKQPKYRNKSGWRDGVYWHSKREYARWLDLCRLQDAGEISSLKRQVSFDLHANGIKVGTYRADFTYHLKNQLVVEDVKAKKRAGQKRSATATGLYQRSKRHLKAEYGLDIVEV